MTRILIKSLFAYQIFTGLLPKSTRRALYWCSEHVWVLNFSALHLTLCVAFIWVTWPAWKEQPMERVSAWAWVYVWERAKEREGGGVRVAKQCVCVWVNKWDMQRVRFVVVEGWQLQSGWVEMWLSTSRRCGVKQGVSEPPAATTTTMKHSHSQRMDYMLLSKWLFNSTIHTTTGSAVTCWVIFNIVSMVLFWWLVPVSRTNVLWFVFGP